MKRFWWRIKAFTHRVGRPLPTVAFSVTRIYLSESHSYAEFEVAHAGVDESAGFRIQLKPLPPEKKVGHTFVRYPMTTEFNTSILLENDAPLAWTLPDVPQKLVPKGA